MILIECADRSDNRHHDEDHAAVERKLPKCWVNINEHH